MSPDTFDFLTRRAGTEWVALMLPVHTSRVYVGVSGWGGVFSGICLVDGKELPQLVGTSAAVKSTTNVITNGKKHELTVKVSVKSSLCTITAALDGKSFATWTGDSSHLSTFGGSEMPCPLSPGAGSWDCITDFHELELILDKGSQAFRLSDTWNCPLLEQQDAPPKEVAKSCIDFKGRKYFISDNPMTLPAARALALQMKGRLLTISSSDENSFIAQQARGVGLWTAGWRPADRNLEWRDERNRPLRYLAHWDANQPDVAWAMQWNLAVFTNGGTGRWNDVESQFANLHACIEWGEE